MRIRNTQRKIKRNVSLQQANIIDISTSSIQNDAQCTNIKHLKIKKEADFIKQMEEKAMKEKYEEEME